MSTTSSVASNNGNMNDKGEMNNDMTPSQTLQTPSLHTTVDKGQTSGTKAPQIEIEEQHLVEMTNWTKSDIEK